MKRDYTFKNQNNTPFIYDSSIESIVKSYGLTLQAASNVLLPLLNSTHFALKLLKEDYTNNGANLVFEVSANNRKLTLTILDDHFIIHSQEEVYTYSFDWDKNSIYLQLVSYLKKIGDKKIYQKIEAHYLTIKIIIESRKFQFEIPFDITYYLDPNYFSFLKETSTITDLIEMYKNRFFPGQTDYEKKLESIISIAKLEGEEEALLDQVVLRKGKMDSYYLSSIKGNVQISIKHSLTEKEQIIITNYANPEEISFDEEIKKLYNKSKKLCFLEGMNTEAKAFIISRTRKKE